MAFWNLLLLLLLTKALDEIDDLSLVLPSLRMQMVNDVKGLVGHHDLLYVDRAFACGGLLF
jgi:hypothetical protein